MTIATATSPNLRAAIQKANQIIFEKEYIVVVADKGIYPKDPVFLQLKYPNGKTRNIGIVHLVHLRGSDWDNMPVKEIAKTTDEVAKAIVDRIALFFDAEARKFYIDESGTIFDFNTISIKLHEDTTFSMNAITVTYKGIPLALKKIKSEGVLIFRQQENGDTELFDTIDLRKGKGIYIDKAGKVYRA